MLFTNASWDSIETIQSEIHFLLIWNLGAHNSMNKTPMTTGAADVLFYARMRTVVGGDMKDNGGKKFEPFSIKLLCDA